MTDDAKRYVGFYITPRVWLREKPDGVEPGIDLDPLGAFQRELAAHLKEQEPVAKAADDGYAVLFFQDGLVKTQIRDLEHGDRASLPRRHAGLLEYLNAIQLVTHVAFLHHKRWQIDIEEVTVGHAFAVGERGVGSPASMTLTTLRWPAWMRPVLPESGIEELVEHTHRVCREPILRGILAQLAIAASHFYAVNFEAAGTQLHRAVDRLWRLFKRLHPFPELSNNKEKREQERLWEESCGVPHTILDGPRNDVVHNNDLQKDRGITPITEALCTQGFAMASAAVGEVFDLTMRIGDGWGWSPWLADS